MRLAVIPARGGSKRIKRKNVAPFAGKPMIGWSIEAAARSACFDRILVSTDDEEIAAVAQQFGADAPFRRPSELAGDHVPTAPVIAHATAWQIEQGVAPHHVCCIYATAPFLRAEDIRVGLQLLEREGVDFAFSVTRYPFPIQRALRITGSNRVQMFEPQHLLSRSQELEPSFHDAAQFYWGTQDAWLQQRPIFGEGSAPVLLPSYRVQDIDTPDDWVRAELMFRALGAYDMRQSQDEHDRRLQD